MSEELARVLETAAAHTITYQQKMAQCLFQCACLEGLDQVGASKCLPTQFINYFQKTMDLFDEATRISLKYLRQSGFSVQCAPECPYCCYQMPIGVTSGELLYLYYGMRQSTNFARFFRRCLEADEIWSNLCRQSASEDQEQPIWEDLIDMTAKRYCGYEHPCPFLHLGRCQIYHYRPLACRMHFSLSPNHWCRPSHFQNHHAVRISIGPAKCVFETLESIEKRLELNVSDVMICGLLELIVNVLEFEKICLV